MIQNLQDEIYQLEEKQGYKTYEPYQFLKELKKI